MPTARWRSCAHVYYIYWHCLSIYTPYISPHTDVFIALELIHLTITHCPVRLCPLAPLLVVGFRSLQYHQMGHSRPLHLDQSTCKQNKHHAIRTAVVVARANNHESRFLWVCICNIGPESQTHHTEPSHVIRSTVPHGSAFFAI